jgi:hypothetical protein
MVGAEPLAPALRSGLVEWSVPWHAEDKAGAVLGEVGLWLVKACLHRDCALLPM